MFEGIYKDLNVNVDRLGCVMLDLEPLDSMLSIDGMGDGEMLYYAQNEDRKWIKGWVAGKNAHVTLLYGLMENAHTWADQVHAVLKDWSIDEVKIQDIGFFESPYEDEPYYCIVAHIEVDEKLLEGHSRLQFLPHIDTFSGYMPHMTVCYIKKDEATRDQLIKLLSSLWVGQSLKVHPEVNLGYAPGEK